MQRLLIPLLLIISFSTCAYGAPVLVNPGFEETGAGDGLAGWQVHTRLDKNHYGDPDYKQNFDMIVPAQCLGGNKGSRFCAGFPREGVWVGKIWEHYYGRDDSGNKVDGREFGKAAISQTVILEPGVYVFGAYLRTAGGASNTATFSFGISDGDSVAYAHDDSTGIRWSSHDLAYKRTPDGTGDLASRSEWLRYQSEPFTVSKRGQVTVWIRFNYVQNHEQPTRWQIDDTFIEEFISPDQKKSEPKVTPTAGAPFKYPLPGQMVVDCADTDEKYIGSDNGSTVRGDIPRRMFQHARCVKGDAWIEYHIPVERGTKQVYVAFEHMGPVKVTIGGRVVRTDLDAKEDTLYPKEYLLTDLSLWAGGKLPVRFESATADKELAVVWMEAGATTRFRERIRNVEWDTTSVPWLIGLWDGTANEYRGSEKVCVIGKTDYTRLNNKELRIEWTQKVKPGHRYYVVLGHMRLSPVSGPVYAQINMGDDDVVEWVSKTEGEEAFDADVTEYLRNGANVVSVKGDAIDYVALVETLPGITDNRKLSLYFAGDELADNMTRVLHNTMFWMMNMHYDDSGFVDASIPHGKWWQQYWPIDISFALRAMLYWGLLDESERVAKLVAKTAWSGHSSNRSGSSDNNGGNLLAMDMCELMVRRGFEPKLTGELWPRIANYCNTVCSDVDKSPFGLIKGTNWENSGNLKQGPSYALTTNLLATWLLRKAADTADAGKLGGDTARWRSTATAIRERVLDKLVFREDVASPTGWVYPRGTWAYGLMDDGSFMLQPLAGYFWAGHYGSGYYGFIDPDKELRRLYDLTEDVATPMFAKGHRGYITGYAESYDGSETTFASAALSDKPSIMDKLLPYMAEVMDYRDDVGARKAEASRWAHGSPGGTEDTNLVGAAEYVDIPRYITGVDDLLYQGNQLRIIPRLPTRWNECGVNDWHVQYLKNGKRSFTSLTFNYKLSGNSASMKISTRDRVEGVRVRFGPFSRDAVVESASVDGRSVEWESELSGEGLWVWVTLETDSAGHTVRVDVE